MIKNLYQPYEILLVQKHAYTERVHQNTFFEMVFVLEGKGIQCINSHHLPYAADKLFLIFPQDKHGFEVQEKTTFLFVRFNDSFLLSQAKEWIKKTEYIFHNFNHLPGCILKTVADKPLVRAMMEALVRENENQYPHAEEVITQLINTIITIVARNIALQDQCASGMQRPSGSLPLLNYIHLHIFDPCMLKAEKIAESFSISPTYISEYFKKTTGESMQQYMMRYKVKLIETRLRYTNMRIQEIANEFGFTDESHLNRIFKKYTGESPTAFRKLAMQFPANTA